MSNESERYIRHAAHGFGLLALVVAGASFLLLMFVPDNAFFAWVSVLGGGLILLTTAAIVGGVFGFLFGIPRTIAEATGTEVTTAKPEIKGKEGFTTNTNLEQISDWLTKAIVGIGLVEAKSIWTRFGELAVQVAPIVAIGDPGVRHVAIAGILMTAGGGAGFLFSYLLTRTFLPLMFAASQRDERFIRLAQVVGTAKFIDADRRVPVNDDTRDALEKIKNYAFGDLKTPEQKMLWGRAQFWAGELDHAVQAFQAVTAEQPDNYEARRHLGWALVLSGKVSAGIGQLQDALRIAEECKSDRTGRYRVDFAWGHLYLQGGYSTTITLLEELRKSPQWADDPRLNTYLAAAYGQSYAASHNAEDRKKALAAVRRVNSGKDAQSWVRLLRSMLHPAAGSSDNDLAVFAGDKDFEEMLGV